MIRIIRIEAGPHILWRAFVDGVEIGTYSSHGEALRAAERLFD